MLILFNFEIIPKWITVGRRQNPAEIKKGAKESSCRQTGCSVWYFQILRQWVHLNGLEKSHHMKMQNNLLKILVTLDTFLFCFKGSSSHWWNGFEQWQKALRSRDSGEPGVVSHQWSHRLWQTASWWTFLSWRALIPGCIWVESWLLSSFVTSFTFVIQYWWC